MRYGTVCSGIEAPTVAWHGLGWKPQWFSEIEPFPCAVLTHHYPDVPNLGDMTKIDTARADGIDLLCGGTPCQDLSDAGTRAGWHGERSGLAWQFLRLVREIMPRWFVWENVSGCMGKRFKHGFMQFVQRFAQLRYGVGWRVLDARYFGSPSPRRRVFVIGNRDSWWRVSKVLFDPDAMCWDSATGTKARLADSRTLTAASPAGRGDAHPIVPCWGDGGQQSQTADAVLFKHQAMPDKSRFPALIDHVGLRWLLPVEWERIMGFPDNYTDVPYRGKPATDTPRYKAIGNSMAVPVVRWIGERIQMVAQEDMSYEPEKGIAV